MGFGKLCYRVECYFSILGPNEHVMLCYNMLCYNTNIFFFFLLDTPKLKFKMH